MIRKLLFPVLAASLLAGCVVGDYAYREGRGDYYYGQPTRQYQYYDSYGGYYPYGAPYRNGYGSSRYGVPYGYGNPYGYYGNSFGFGFGGYYGRPVYRPHRPRPPQGHPDGGHPGNGGDHHGDNRGNDGNRPPWRDFNQLRRRPVSGGGGAAPMPMTPAAPQVQPRQDRSPMQQAIREGVRRRSRESSEQQQP